MTKGFPSTTRIKDEEVVDSTKNALKKQAVRQVRKSSNRIKLEESGKHESLLEGEPSIGIERLKRIEGNLPDENEPNLYCILCNRHYTSKSSYRCHLRIVHKMNLAPARSNWSKANPDITPDIDDPNWYCKSCNNTYNNQESYRTHLRKVHKMILARLPTRKRLRPDVIPDVDDPNWFCKSCESYFKTQDIYRKHIKRIHKIAISRLPPPLTFNPRIQPNIDDPDCYCCSCDKKYSTVEGYRVHLKNIHKMKLEPRKPSTSPSNPAILPDIDDPNFYCRSCDRAYKSRGQYRNHITFVHKIVLESLTKRPKFIADIDLINVNDHNITCCIICRLDFSNRECYGRHMLRHERLGNKPLRGKSKINSNITPDVTDPNNYCKSCDQAFTAVYSYKLHLRNIHKMELPAAVRQTTVQDSHCKTCNFTYACNKGYYNHLKNVHKLTFKLVGGKRVPCSSGGLEL